MIRIHGVPLSPFVRKALFTLEHKGVDYELNPIMPQSDDAAFRAISPLGKIPVLEHDGFTVPDTSIICRYLDRQFPDKSIYPDDPQLEAGVCWLEEFADTKLMEALAGLFVQRFLHPKLLGRPTDEARVKELLDTHIPSALDYLETQIPESGPLIGDSISIADIAVVTCFIQGSYGDFELDREAYPGIARYLDAAMSTDLVKNRLAEERKSLPG